MPAFKVKVDGGEVLKCRTTRESARKCLEDLCKKRHGEMLTEDVAKINLGSIVPWLRIVRIHEVENTWTPCPEEHWKEESNAAKEG